MVSLVFVDHVLDQDQTRHCGCVLAGSCIRLTRRIDSSANSSHVGSLLPAAPCPKCSTRNAASRTRLTWNVSVVRCRVRFHGRLVRVASSCENASASSWLPQIVTRDHVVAFGSSGQPPVADPPAQHPSHVGGDRAEPVDLRYRSVAGVEHRRGDPLPGERVSADLVCLAEHRQRPSGRRRLVALARAEQPRGVGRHELWCGIAAFQAAGAVERLIFPAGLLLPLGGRCDERMVRGCR